MSGLTDEQWFAVESCIPEARHPSGRGRPRAENRAILDGILWVMRSGSSWRSLPRAYPSRDVCRRRFLQWKDSGTLVDVLERLEEDLRFRTGRDALDGTVGLPADVRDRSSWWWQTILVLRSPYARMLRGNQLPPSISAP